MLSESLCGVCKRKVVLIGSMGVGKTSLAVRFVRGEFDDAYIVTIGASFLQRSVVVGDQTVCYQIWDTAGTERYHCLMPMYLRDTDIAVVVYDVTELSSFQEVGMYLDQLRRHAPDHVVTVLVGNKTDKTQQRVVSYKMGQDFADKRDLIFLETSAKTGQGVDDIFPLGNARLTTIEKQSTVALTDTKVDPRQAGPERSRHRCCVVM